MRFTIPGMYLAAVTIRDDDDPEGDWYTTITDEASEHLPFGDHASGRILPRSSERPASRRDHWAVGRPLVRTCSPVIATFAASRRASSPRSPAACPQSYPTTHGWRPSPRAYGHSSSRSRTRCRRAAGSTPEWRTGARPAERRRSLAPNTRARPAHEVAVADSGGCCGLKPGPSPLRARGDGRRQAAVR